MYVTYNLYFNQPYSITHQRPTGYDNEPEVTIFDSISDCLYWLANEHDLENLAKELSLLSNALCSFTRGD